MGKRFRCLVHLLLLHPPPFPLLLLLRLPHKTTNAARAHLFCVTVRTSKTSFIISRVAYLNRPNLPTSFSTIPLRICPPFNQIQHVPGCVCGHRAFIITPLRLTSPCLYDSSDGSRHNHGAARPVWLAPCACVLLMLLVRQTPAGIFQCHPHQWEALCGDMSAPCLLVVLMKPGVGRVGSLVQVPGFPFLNESASPHSNRLLPWELRLGLPSAFSLSGGSSRSGRCSQGALAGTARASPGSVQVGADHLIKRVSLWPVLALLSPICSVKTR